MNYSALKRISEYWCAVEKTLITSLTAASLLVSTYAMITRYLAPAFALDWADEAVIYLITWAIWLAGARAVMGADHIKADFAVKLLPCSWHRYIEMMQDFLAMTLCVVVMVGGIQVVQLSLMFGERSDSSLALPLWIYYLCLPFGLGVVAIRYACRLLGDLGSTKAIKRVDEPNGTSGMG